MVLHFFKRIYLISNAFYNELKPLHNTFPSESNVFAADSDKHFWQSAKDKVAIQNEKQLYFISVFIYTFIKVKLTEGEKMASPKPNRTITADFLFWLQKTQKSCSQNRHDSSPCQATKANPKIREPISDFTATIGEIITDMPYLCEPEVSEQKRAIFLFFSSLEDKLRLKTLNLQFSAKKQVNFRSFYLLSHKLLIIN